MSKIKYDEFDDEMNPFHPCLSCGGEGFGMNWNTGLYECNSCGLTLEVAEKKENKPKSLKKFRGLDIDDEIY
jgi:hypothetical protein